MATALRNILASETYTDDNNEKHDNEIARVEEINPREKFGWMDENNNAIRYNSIYDAIAAFLIASIMVPIRAMLKAWGNDTITDYITSRMVPDMMDPADFKLDTYLQRMGDTTIDKADEKPIGKAESIYRALLKRKHDLESAIALYDDPSNKTHIVVNIGNATAPYDFSDTANTYARLYKRFPMIDSFRKNASRYRYMITSAGYAHYVDMLIETIQQIEKIKRDRYMVAAEMQTMVRKSNGDRVSRVCGYKVIDTHTDNVYYIKTVKIGDMRIATRTYTYGALAHALVEPVITRYNHRVLDYVSYKFMIAPLKTTDTDIH